MPELKLVLPTKEYLEIYHPYNPLTGLFTDLSGREGYLSSDGYRMFSIYGKQYLVHRLIYKRQTGLEPNIIDHEDGNKLNNIYTNLINGDEQDNGRNKTINSNNTSGYPGVHFDKSRNRWRAVIYVGTKFIHLGRFGCPTNAWVARMQFAKQHPELGFTKRHMIGN